MSPYAKTLVRYAVTLDTTTVERWKKDLRVMTKIYKDLESEDQAKWDEARRLFRRFRDNLEDWIYKQLLPKATSDRAHSPFEASIAKLAWDLRHNLDPTMLFPILHPGRVPDWSKFRAERERNLKRYQRSASKLFKEIQLYLETKPEGRVERRDPVQHFEVSGIGVVVRNTGRTEANDEALDLFLRSLRRYATKISAAGFPAAVRGLTVTVDFDVPKSEWDTAAMYNPAEDALTMYPLGLARVQGGHGTFTHECGHRFYFKNLSPSARQRWETVMTERGVQIGQDDIDRFVALVKAEVNPENPNALDLRRVILPKARDEFEAAKFRELVHVPVGPLMGGPFDELQYRVRLSGRLGEYAQVEEISDYANTSPIEAFAEVFRIWVDKGPQALGPWTREFFVKTCRGGGVRLAAAGQRAAVKVAARFTAASRVRCAMEHASPEALQKYLREHPKANPANHTVAEKPAKQPKQKVEPASNPFAGGDRSELIKAHASDFDKVRAVKVETYTSERAKQRGPEAEALLASEFSKMSAPERAVLVGAHKLGRKFESGLSKAEAKSHAHYFDRWRTTAGPYDYKGNGDPEDLELTSCKLQGLVGAFGFKGSMAPEDKELDKDGAVTKAMKQGRADNRLRAHVKKMYDYQQAYFERAGITELTMYRGVRFPDTDTAEGGVKVQIESRELASFTLDPAVAASFGRVVKFKVPVKNVFASPLVRPNLGSESNQEDSGCFHEAEIIVMGASELTGETIGGRWTEDE